jgi:hypothetical protein
LARELGDERILVVVLPHAVDAERFVDDLALFTDLPVAHLPALEAFAVGDDDVAEDPATAGRLLLVSSCSRSADTSTLLPQLLTGAVCFL